MAAQLGTTAEHLWGAVVRNQIISGSISLLALAIYSGCVIFLWKAVRARLKYHKEQEESISEGTGGLIAAAVVTSIVWMIISFVSLGGWISQVINPEYSAIRDVSERIKELK
jgi:uncharacterized membrane-anchored protein